MYELLSSCYRPLTRDSILLLPGNREARVGEQQMRGEGRVREMNKPHSFPQMNEENDLGSQFSFPSSHNHSSVILIVKSDN